MVYNLSIFNEWYHDTIKYNNVTIEYDDGYRQELFINKEGRTSSTPSDITELNKKYAYKVYYIKDQRLQPQIEIKKDGLESPSIKIRRDAIILTVEKYAKEMAGLLEQKKREESALSEKLTATQFDRVKECKPLDERDYKERFAALLKKYHQLEIVGLYPVPLKYADYTENRQYLTVFLEDFEQRISIYNEILLKSLLFNDLLAAKELNNKKITINKDKGFSAITEGNQSLKLSTLSSGEQQEIILLYELLFKVKEDSLVLIDEPETSMHVEWQSQFIPDLRKIKQINNNLSFLIATHSPQIIGNDWDLSVDLFDISKGNTKNA
jgi:predicted ATPase